MSKLKISADTSPIKKSLLELSNEVKKLGKGTQKVSLISESDKKFFKQELAKELVNIKKKMIDNRQELSKLVAEQRKLKSGSAEELQIRNKIVDAYRQQNRLARESNTMQGASDQLGGGGGLGGKLKGMLGGKLGKLGLMGAALGVGAWTYGKARQGMGMYEAGIPDRLRLTGMGVSNRSGMSASQLASAGMTEQDMISRRVAGVSQLGSSFTNRSALNQAKFERSYGMESGSLLNSATSLRSNFGGRGAMDIQNKIQASIIASGMDEALGPHLQAMTGLLSSINNNGVSSVGDLIYGMANMAKSGSRTSEQLASTFGGMDSAIKGASGERAAFMQTAFARAGIGGRSIGGTRFAMESGGLTGLDQSAFAGRGYSPELVKQLEKDKVFNNTGDRISAILGQFGSSGGAGAMSSIKNSDQFYRMNNMANSILGTSGSGGSDALLAAEQLQKGLISKDKYNETLTNITAGTTPDSHRLDKVNSSLAGQTQALQNIEKTLLIGFGENVEGAANILRKARNIPLGMLGYDSSVGMESSYDEKMSSSLSPSAMPGKRKSTTSSSGPDTSMVEAIRQGTKLGMQDAQVQKSQFATGANKTVLNAYLGGEKVSETTFKRK